MTRRRRCITCGCAPDARWADDECECRCHVPSEQDDAEPAELSGRGWAMWLGGYAE